MEATTSAKKIYKREPNWCEEEKTILISEVQKRSDKIFGKFKGCGHVKGRKVRQEAWQEVVDVLNSLCTNHTRTVEAAIKQHQNLRARAKAITDEIRRPPTGGGPPTKSPSPAEEAMIGNMLSNPILKGIDGGIDTDEAATYVVMPMEEAPEPEPTTSTSDHGDGEDTRPPITIEAMTAPIQSKITEKRPLDVIVNDNGILQHPCPKKKKVSLQDEEILTLQYERLKYTHEIEKIIEETKYFTARCELVKSQKEKVDFEIELLKQKVYATES